MADAKRSARQGRRKIELGQSGRMVAANVRRLRTEANLTYAALARRLNDLGWPIAVLGLTRIENEERRVDVDDLVALSRALEVSPITLLMAAPGHDDAALTGIDGHLDLFEVWQWLRAEMPIDPPPEFWGLKAGEEQPAWPTHYEGDRYELAFKARSQPLSREATFDAADIGFKDQRRRLLVETSQRLLDHAALLSRLAVQIDDDDDPYADTFGHSKLLGETDA